MTASCVQAKADAKEKVLQTKQDFKAERRAVKIREARIRHEKHQCRLQRKVDNLDIFTSVYIVCFV